MLTLNFECFYLFQSLSHFHFGRGFLGPRQSPRAGLGHRDQQVQRHEGAGGGGGGGGVMLGTAPTHTHTHPLAWSTPTPAPLVRPTALRKASAGGQRRVQE